MEYLVNINKPSSKAHIWNDTDTYCKMYLTGGMRKIKYKVSKTNENKLICLMCKNNYNNLLTNLQNAYNAPMDNREAHDKTSVRCKSISQGPDFLDNQRR